MSDLCWVCQQNSMAIMRAANTPEAEKSQVTKDLKKKYKHHTHVYAPIGSEGCRGTSFPSHTGEIALH